MDEQNKNTLVDSLYHQNILISGKNKTLSLLSKLYEFSIQTLTPKILATKISLLIQLDLSFELVGVLLLNKETKTFEPLGVSCSERLQNVEQKFGVLFQNIFLQISNNEFLN